jgi:hypothetical protein
MATPPPRPFQPWFRPSPFGADRPLHDQDREACGSEWRDYDNNASYRQPVWVRAGANLAACKYRKPSYFINHGLLKCLLVDATWLDRRIARR